MFDVKFKSAVLKASHLLQFTILEVEVLSLLVSPNAQFAVTTVLTHNRENEIDHAID
jgi:hypothetical protein